MPSLWEDGWASGVSFTWKGGYAASNGNCHIACCRRDGTVWSEASLSHTVCTSFKPEHSQIFSPGQSVSMLEHHSNKITLSLVSQPDGSPLVLDCDSLGEF